jgi:hypothetical protein
MWIAVPSRGRRRTPHNDPIKRYRAEACRARLPRPHSYARWPCLPSPQSRLEPKFMLDEFIESFMGSKLSDSLHISSVIWAGRPRCRCVATGFPPTPPQSSGQANTFRLNSPHATHHPHSTAPLDRLPQSRGGLPRSRRRSFGRRHTHRTERWQNAGQIRLHGVDAPETGQDYGSRAKQASSEMAFGKMVTIRPHDTDRFGRTVAEVILSDGRLLNQEMVGQGAAW